MGVVSAIKGAVRRTLIARSDGIDLSRLDKVPDTLSWPLNRDVMAPTARLGRVRDEAPVHKLTSFLGLDIWLVTGDAEAREVLGDTTSYSTDIRPYMGRRGSTTDGDFGGLGFTDPPEHTRLRKLLTPEFTMRRLRRLGPGIKAIIEHQLDEVERAAAAGDGTVDLVPTYAFPVPFLVICDLLGMPDEKRETFSSLATARFDVSKGGTGTVGAIGGSRDFLLAEAARQRHEPGPGLIGQIIREHGEEINDFDLGGLADGVFTGGLETSASMLALGTAVLLENRDLWDRLVADPDNETGDVDAIVEELLRHSRRWCRWRSHGSPRTTWSSPASRSARARWSWLTCRRPTATRAPPPATRSTCGARAGRTSRSATGSTAASVPSWHGWSCGWRSRCWRAASPTCGSPYLPRTSSTAPRASCTASTRCRSRLR